MTMSISMTKVLKPLDLDIYVFIDNISIGRAKSIGIGPKVADIDTQIKALLFIREGLYWRVDIYTISDKI